MVDREIVGQRPGQDDGVDPAGRSAGDHIDDDPQIEVLADLLEQVEINRLGVVPVGPFGLGLAIGELVPPDGVVARVVGLRGARQFENFLGHAVDVDGERNAAEANQREA